jgi:hypothetical protein
VLDGQGLAQFDAGFNSLIVIYAQSAQSQPEIDEAAPV